MALLWLTIIFIFIYFFSVTELKKKNLKKSVRYSRTTFHTVLRLVKVASILHVRHTPNQCRDGKSLWKSHTTLQSWLKKFLFFFWQRFFEIAVDCTQCRKAIYKSVVLVAAYWHRCMHRKYQDKIDRVIHEPEFFV